MCRGLAALPYLSSSGGRFMQLIHTVGRQKAAKWFAARRGETAEYRTNLQAKLVFIERNGAEPDKEPSPMLENFLQTKPPSSKSTRKMSNEFGSSSVTSLAASIEADQLQDVQPREKFPQTRCPVRSAAKNSKPYKPPPDCWPRLSSGWESVCSCSRWRSVRIRWNGNVAKEN